ncbi:universal stress protein [Roseicella aerolata]|uniref:Universal stress protein n=1 Tax=Roseicella aerolata TaxID=2883479 RepID=A0A9X1ICY2_9PROT|nr:universal stress protein [Roseicella aerolata]MCB4822424.1 universal stress protein [Roseicella aerolata]
MSQTGDPAAAGQARRRLLAATDLSSRSDRALRRAGLLARAMEAELLLLHAVDDDQPRSLVEAERREAWALLRQQAAGLPELQAAGATPLVEEGDPFEAVLRIAEARSVDLVVLGEHRRRPLRDIFVGTTVERVMRHGRQPVLMVNQPPAGPYRRILAATDLSEHAARALRAAARLGLLAGADLTLLHAFEPPGMGAVALANLPEAEVRAHAQDAAREARGALDRFAAGLGLDRPPLRLVEEGRAATVVKEAAARLRPDLLVIGTAGAGGLRRALLGSVAAEVLAAIRCDALAVPPEAAR